MARVLLINPSYRGCYGNAKASIVNPIFPTLGLSMIAASALQRGHQVSILDLSWKLYDWREISTRIKNYSPDIVGITAMTPLMNQLRDLSVLVRDISKEIMLVGGGAHPSALPAASLKQSLLDFICAGEADFSFGALCDQWKAADPAWSEDILAADPQPIPPWYFGNRS